MYVFDVRLADADRAVDETLTLRVAQHPSTRLLAHCLEHAAGIAFSKGLSDPDEPTISVRDQRLHRAAKAAPDDAVFGDETLTGVLEERRLNRR